MVRLGFTAVSAISILGPLLRRLTAELPDVEVRLSERVTNAQVDGIRRGELDIGLARPPFDTARCRPASCCASRSWRSSPTDTRSPASTGR